MYLFNNTDLQPYENRVSDIEEALKTSKIAISKK